MSTEREKNIVLAVDCGSTNMKVALFSSALRQLAVATVPVEYSRDADGWVELSAEAVWRAFTVLVDDVCSQGGVAPGAISHVAFGSQAQTFALTDQAGAPRTPFFSWLDRRASREAREVDECLGEEFHRHCSFSPPIAALQICKMVWLRHHAEERIDAQTRLTMLPGFLGWRLGADNVTDRNLAAMGGAYSMVTGQWWKEALALCGFRTENMPKLVDVGTRVEVNGQSMHAELAPRYVTYAGNDQTAGAFGNGCTEDSLVITLGTALVVYRVTGNRPGVYHKGCFWGPYPGARYYELATIDEGCHALDWACENLGSRYSARDIDTMAAAIIGMDRQDEAPFFHPQRMGDGKAWTRACDPDLMAYAVLEGITFALRRLLRDGLGIAAPELCVEAIGGGSNSSVWLSLLADALGLPLRQGSGDALRGGAALALGKTCDPGSEARDCVVPDHGRAERLDKRYQRWCAQ